MKETPIYFNGPTDEVSEVDPYEEFEVPEEIVEDTPEENALNDDEIIIDSEEEELTIDEVIERTNDSLPKEADAIKDLDEEIIDDIVEGVNEETSIPKDYFYDLDGVKHAKDQLLSHDDLIKIINSIESVYGILCVNGVNDLDFKNPFTGKTLEDLLKNGLFSFASCFLIEGMKDGLDFSMQDAVINAGKNIIGSDGAATIEWIDSTLDDGITTVLYEDIVKDTAKNYMKPPSSISDSDELDRITDSFNKIDDDWFSVGSKKNSDFEYSNIDTIKEASDEMRMVFEYSDQYLEALAVTDEYDIETELTNYPFAL